MKNIEEQTTLISDQSQRLAAAKLQIARCFCRYSCLNGHLRQIVFERQRMQENRLHPVERHYSSTEPWERFSYM